MADDKKPEPKPEPKPAKKGWSNPALRAMGIPRISLPSRNWMIFWTVLASIGGGIYYDKHQQKLIRDKYMKQVESLGQEIYTSERLPRKLTIFIAPPPDDFLEESVRHFRRYIKPILNAAAIDYDVYTENRQGEIRSEVAEKVRQLRRERIEQEQKSEAHAREEAYAKSWTKFFKEDVPKVFQFRKEPEPEVYVARHELYDVKDLVGLYRVLGTVQPVRDDVADEVCGGVICVGRGAYKEYVNGIHEGLLGPLEKPEEPVQEAAIDIVQEVREGGEQEATESTEKKEEPDSEDFAQKEGEAKQEPVPKAYISAQQYAQGVLAPELDLSHTVRNDKNVPVLFEQPVYVFPVPKLSGFLKMPQKIYRYFTLRNLADDVGKHTLTVVEGRSRPFEFKDKFLGKEEELDWPKKWVERGRTKNSEWVQELEVDDRVTQRMRVFGAK